MFNGKWTYETGEEVAEIFGSGSSYYHVYETDNIDEALHKYNSSFRNYLIRKQFKDGHMIREFYDDEKKTFL